jgi:hypothetical protein
MQTVDDEIREVTVTAVVQKRGCTTFKGWYGSGRTSSKSAWYGSENASCSDSNHNHDLVHALGGGHGGMR